MSSLDHANLPNQGRPVRRFGSIALYVLAVVALVLGCRNVSRDHEDINAYMSRRDARTATAEGTVTRFYSNILRSGREQPMEIIQFTAESGETFEGKAVRRGDAPGRHYTVRYDPRDPHNYALPEIGDPGYSWKDAFLGNVPFFVIALYFLWLAWRIGRGPGQDASRLD
jgi:hypothetical protein